MGKRSKFWGFFFKLEVGMMTPRGWNTVGTSQEDAAEYAQDLTPHRQPHAGSCPTPPLSPQITF